MIDFVWKTPGRTMFIELPNVTSLASHAPGAVAIVIIREVRP
jgi:hypothetical protein